MCPAALAEVLEAPVPFLLGLDAALYDRLYNTSATSSAVLPSETT